MIHPDIVIDKLEELGANFSKMLSKPQRKLIFDLVKNMTEDYFVKRINNLMSQDTFPKNLKIAFAIHRKGLKNCDWKGCKLAATILGFHGNQNFCSWHDFTIEDPKNNNTQQIFEDWRNEIASHKDDDSCNSDYPSDRQAFLNYFTWDRVNSNKF